MARDDAVDVTKMRELVAMHRELLSEQRKTEFHIGLAEMANDMPAINRRGKIIIKDKQTGQVIQETRFARWEDLHRAVTPTLVKHGFALTHRTEMVESGKLRVISTLARNGHERETMFDLPYDTTGSKNNVQAIGSSSSYGKRYNTIMLLNIRTEGEDNDAATADIEETITTEQATALIMSINDIVGEEAGKALVQRLCEGFGIKKLTDMRPADLPKAEQRIATYKSKVKERQ